MNKFEAARRAAKHEPRQTFYPLWGVEYRRPESNARKYYRNGDVCAWCRYVIAPRGDGLLWCGWTIGDTLTTLAVVAITVPLVLLAIDQFGLAFDRYADAMGW